jgi:hypothetical protein
MDLVQRYWGVKAEHHIDPTFLLSRQQYQRLVHEDGQAKPLPGNLFVYVLDRSGGKGQIIDKATKALKLTAFELLPPKPTSRREFFAHRDDYQFPPVTQWLRSFMEAEFVITDSFHGTALSIIFNKPFLAIGNQERGLARFNSLLKVFGLEDRLVADPKDVTAQLLRASIDWPKVNAIKRKEQQRAHDYLSKYLHLTRKG